MNIAFAFVLPALICGLSCEAYGATIRGSISDDTGSLLSGVQVNLRAVPVVTRGSSAISAAASNPIVSVSAAGQFEFADVAPGTYYLCIIPNDRLHINSCAGRRRGGGSITISPGDTIIQTNLSATIGVPVLLTVTLAKSTSEQPTAIFLDSDDGRFFPMEKDTESGRFWVVAPPQCALRVVTAVIGGKYGLPSEFVTTGAAGIPVVVSIAR